jgi:lipid II:glycine glycyltransferase (peptidoglycan interpeptide bridge formation enzyme)
MKFISDENIDLDKWQSLLDSSIYTSPFQTPAFYHVHNQHKKQAAHVFAIEQEGEYKALVVVTIQSEKGPISFLSTRGIVYGGPLINTNDQRSISFFLEQVVSKIKFRVIYIETRNFFNYSFYKQSFLDSSWMYEHYLNFQLPLASVEKNEITSLFSYNRRNEIKKSIANGAIYDLCSTQQEIAEIYAILKDLYNKKVKLPLPDLKYFVELFNQSILKAFIVKHDGTTIGGSFCIVLPNKSMYTFYYCGLREYSKKIYPTHLAVLAAMEYGVENNIPLFDFMGAGKPGEVYGVRDYKVQFGGELVEYGRFLYVTKPLFFKIAKIGLSLWKKLKK